MLFDSYEDDIKNLKFDNTLGGQKGTHIQLSGSEYTIDGMQIYTDQTTDHNKIDQYQFDYQLTIVVK